MTRALRIALVAHPRHRIAPPFEGGMEAHTHHLARGLAARGHAVTLVAAGGSEAGVPLAALTPEPYEARFPWARWRDAPALHAHLDEAHARALALVEAGGFDVVHNNGLHRFVPRFSRARRRPMVSVMHVPPFDALSCAIRGSAAPWHLVAHPSERQRAAWWDAPPPEARVVPNGIDPAAWPFAPHGGEGAVWAGRIMANKGAGHAARAARIAGMPLAIFGAIEDRAYFEAAVAPHLGAGVRYGGHLPGAALAREMGRARALLFTPMWDEPFGLAAIEAMACGLPVAAFDAGAAREVIGPCGAFAPMGDVAALAGALDRASAIPRAACRARVEARFTLSRMIEGYEALYREAIARRGAPWPEARYSARELAPSLADPPELPAPAPATARRAAP